MEEKYLLNGEQVERYIREVINAEPRHNCDDLAMSINEVAHEFECDTFKLMKFVLTNEPIDSLHTHSYGFHTNNGRAIIDKVIDAYNNYQLNKLEIYSIKYNGK